MIRMMVISGLLGGSVALVAGCGRPIAASQPADPQRAEEIRKVLLSKAVAAPSATAGAAAKATGWATIKGRFVYDGTPPSPKAISINKDLDVCGKHRLVDESLVVGTDGGLANAVLFVRNRNVEVHPSYEATANQPVTLDNKDCRFEPHVATLRTSQPLMVKNSDSVGHNTNAALVANAPFNVVVSADTEAEQKLDSGESFPIPVTCNIHPWMKGYVLVQPHPYMAVSAEDGTFEIKNVPAGVPLEFQAWHEASTGAKGALQADLPDLKWQPNGRFTVTLEPDQTLDLKEIKIPAAKLAAQ